MKVKSEREVAQSCPTLSDPMDYRLPGSSVHGIFQARVLEWGAIAFCMLKLFIKKISHATTGLKILLAATKTWRSQKKKKERERERTLGIPCQISG